MEKQLGWTTIEQSEKLIKAGLNPNTADMLYLYDWNNHKHNNTPDTLIICNWEDPYNKSIPCWSLGTLIDLMPKYLTSGKKYFDLIIIPWLSQVQYINLAINSTEERTYMGSRMEKTLMDSIVSMIERLLACKSTYLVEVKNGLI